MNAWCNVSGINFECIVLNSPEFEADNHNLNKALLLVPVWPLWPLNYKGLAI